MRISYSILLFCLWSAVFAQEGSDSLATSYDTINAEIVSQYTSYFTIEDGEMAGIGSEILQDEFANSQFVLLGETHDDIQTALFTNAILPILAEEGYQHFVIEQGRTALDLLFLVLKDPINMRSDLRKLHQGAVNKSGEPYFPFLDGEEDADFMQTAFDKSYQFHGIDQEFFYSFPFLFNQMSVFAETNNLNPTEDYKEELGIAYLKASNYLIEQYKIEKRQKDHPIFTNLLASEEINTFFKLANNNAQNEQIIDDIILSWKIYEQHRLNRALSIQMRADLMKERFLAAYRSVSKDGRKPKMLIKLGGLHVMRGKTPLGVTDIGETVNQLARKNRTQDLNLYFMFRYYLDEEEEKGYFDNAEGSSKWLKERRPILLQGKPDEWALVDLKSLKSAMEEEFIYLYPPIQKLIQRHDYILIPPATDDVRPNYEPK